MNYECVVCGYWGPDHKKVSEHVLHDHPMAHGGTIHPDNFVIKRVPDERVSV